MFIRKCLESQIWNICNLIGFACGNRMRMKLVLSNRKHNKMNAQEFLHIILRRKIRR